MAVIDEEEGNEQIQTCKSKEVSVSKVQNPLLAQNNELKELKNMHNTTTGFYPQKFGDRVPTRGDMQSR